MKFLDAEECRAWARANGVPLDDSEEPLRPAKSPRSTRWAIPKEHARLAWFSRHLSRAVGDGARLLWLTEWGIWTSAENEHLICRLRGSYGERRPISEAPGAWCGPSEDPDLVTFLQVSILSGWGGHLLSEGTGARAYFSHDEFVELASTDEARSVEFARALAPFGRP